MDLNKVDSKIVYAGHRSHKKYLGVSKNFFIIFYKKCNLIYCYFYNKSKYLFLLTRIIFNISKIFIIRKIII